MRYGATHPLPSFSIPIQAPSRAASYWTYGCPERAASTQQSLARMEERLPIIFLTGHGDIPTSVHAMKAGAVDFLTKPVGRDALLSAVKNALDVDAKGRATRAVLRALQDRYENLTSREREVLAHVVSGKLNKQIAFDLGAAERTIKAHRASIMDKLQVQSVAELVRLAQELGIQPIR